MGFFDRLRKTQKIADSAEKDEHFSSRQEDEKDSSTDSGKGNKEKKSAKKVVKKDEENTAALPKVKGDVLLYPIVTEKNTLAGTYAFAVATGANKQEIKKAIVQSYGETPSKVTVMSVVGKKVRWSGKTGQRKDWKKAVVRFPEGKTINVHDA